MNDFLNRLNSLFPASFKPDLRLWLVVIGVAFIALIWFYNIMQERRVRRQFQKPSETSGAGSSIMKSPEPKFSTDAATSSPRHEPGFASTPQQSLTPDIAAPIVEIDEEIHVLIVLNAEQVVTGERILTHLQGFRHAGRQPIILAAAPLDSESTSSNAAWVAVQPGGRYETIVVAVQLANRSGALNEIEYSQCVTSLQQAAELIPANCDAPEMMETIARARALDARCAPLDAQIGINIIHPQGHWNGEQIDTLARENGLMLRADGRYHAVIDSGQSLFTLHNADTTNQMAFRADTLNSLSTMRLTFLLDVPRAPHASKPYLRMKTLAIDMAERLEGIIVDDDLHTLTPAILDSIEREIEPVYARLEAEHIPAGSARALALFS